MEYDDFPIFETEEELSLRDNFSDADGVLITDDGAESLAGNAIRIGVIDTMDNDTREESVVYLSLEDTFKLRNKLNQIIERTGVTEPKLVVDEPAVSTGRFSGCGSSEDLEPTPLQALAPEGLFYTERFYGEGLEEQFTKLSDFIGEPASNKGSKEAFKRKKYETEVDYLGEDFIRFRDKTAKVDGVEFFSDPFSKDEFVVLETVSGIGFEGDEETSVTIILNKKQVKRLVKFLKFQLNESKQLKRGY